MAKAPKLPATDLAPFCYEHMFSYCTELKEAPELPATKLAKGCYRSMFDGCINLNYIKALFTDDPESNTSNWVHWVAPSGTFVKSHSATWNIIGDNGIPSGWTVQEAP